MSILSRAPSRSVSPDPDQPTCTLAYVRRQLGRGDYGDRRMVGLVKALIEREGFPPPLPQMVKGALTHAVTPKSAWIRPAVDAWLDDFLPPANAAAVDLAAAQRAGADMDARAGTLGGLTLVAGGRA